MKYFRCIADEFIKFRDQLENRYCSSLTTEPVNNKTLSTQKQCRKKQVWDMVDQIYNKAYR